MNNQCLSRPIPMKCTACGASNQHPRISTLEDRFRIVTEAKYVCGICGNFFHKSTVSIQEKNQEVVK